MRIAIFLWLLMQVLAAAQSAPPGDPIPTTSADESAFRVDRQTVPGGAELVTLFGRLNDPRAGSAISDVPLLSVVRDTLGDQDPSNDRLRYVWILTSTRPTPWQRAASAISFLSFRAGSKHHANRAPSPVIDLGAPARTVWPNLLADGLQSTQVDPLGMLVRASTRSYRGNSSDYRTVQIFQTLGALDGLGARSARQSLLPDAEVREIYSRLSLSDRTLGGLVSQKNLSKYYDKESTRQEQTRGHNWELLRQRAEISGLYFEPLALPDASPNQAMLWVAREDLDGRAGQRFDSQFLNIANPWTDERLRNWTGYTEVRYFDSEHRPVHSDADGARPVELIPLALYGLDHPRAPLLLADFRDTRTPRRLEMIRHGTTTLLAGVLGISRFGNWPFFAAESAWTFVRGRHGASVNRSARLRTYSEARGFLALDTRMNPELRSELSGRLDHLAMNPLDNDISTEANLAAEQYGALLQYARSQDGLESRLERDRRAELRVYTQSRGRRVLGSLARIFFPGIHTSSGAADPRVELAAYRRAAHHVRFLEQLLAMSPRPEVVWDASEISESIDALSAEPASSPRVSRLIARIFARSEDPSLRIACLRSLRHSNTELAHNELWRLSQDPGTPETWRALCLLYSKGDVVPALASAPGGQ